MTKNYTFKKQCRVCESKDMVKILNLGQTPLANAFISKNELKKKEEKFPLVLYFCKNCSLVQLRHVIDPKILFKDYHYLTGASEPLVKHFQLLGAEIADTLIKSKEDFVIEIGSNDGVLLEKIKNKGKILGIDPANNIAKIALKRGVPTLVNLFTEELSKKVTAKYGLAKVVVANNVAAHVDNIRGFFKGVSNLLRNDGVFIFEVHWVGNLIGDGGFDQIYHEHLCYYSLHALEYLTKSVGLKIFDIKLIPIHGRSMRVYAGKNIPIKKSVNNFLKMERGLGLNKQQAYLKFSNKVEKSRQKLLKLLKDIKKKKMTIIGYGAPAKGNTLLNYFGIDNKVLDFITDSTILKQGLYAPGSRILIKSPDEIKKHTPDYILLLSWNYADAILKKEEALRKAGVKFIIPVPEVRIV